MPSPTGIFDAENPPSRAGLDTCVHCGFCLPTCPTYALGGEEMDSPRGRIHLMQAGLDGRVQLTPRFVRHFDACLGCLACVTACPSGVEYGTLIESTRAQIERHHRRGWWERLVRLMLFAVAPHPARLRLAAAALAPTRWLAAAADRVGLLSRLPAAVRAAVRLMPRHRSASDWSATHAVSAAGERRLTVGMLTGCVQRVFFHEVNEATVAVLAAEGCDVVAPPQGCCGALELHSGLDDSARARARSLIAAFEAVDVEVIVANVAGCGSAMKDYGRLLADDPAWAERAARFAARVRDVSEVLDQLGPPRATRHPLDVRVAYHDACHLSHAQGVTREPRAMLESIPGVALVPLDEPDICCGSAGVYNVLHPEPAAELGARKAAHIDAADPDIIATANAGCLLQLAAAQRDTGGTRPVLHPIQIVQASIDGRWPRPLRRT